MNTPPRARSGEFALRRLGIAILRIGTAVGVLIYLFRLVNIERMLEALRGASTYWVAAAFASTMILQWVVAVRLRRLVHLQDLTLSTFEAFEINLAARFYGLFLPGGNITGVAVRVLRLAQVTNNYSGTGVAMAADRLAATVTLCLIGIVFWLVERPDQGRIWIGTLGIVLFGIAIPIILFFRHVPMPFLERLLIRRLGSLHNALSRFRSLGAADLAVILTLSAVAHLIGIGCFWMLSQALDLETGLVSMGWIRSCILLPTLLPVTVAGLGLREGAAILLLGLFGVSEDRALAFGLLIFTITALGVGMVGGLLESWRWLAPRRARNGHQV